jgi:uncharacterized protein with ParB-like and HNH nuclease domain
MDIRTADQSLEEIFSGHDTHYMVPNYQRDYAWKQDQIEELWEDIIISNCNNTEYFMGTVVLSPGQTGNSKEFNIIDGQQRLTTFAILFSVISSIAYQFSKNRELFKDVERNDISHRLADDTYNYARQLLLQTRGGRACYFLSINKKDQYVFSEVIESHQSIIFERSDLLIRSNEPRIIKARKVFFSRIWDKYGQSVDALSELNKLLIHISTNLIFIKIIVQSDYDAFLLFESLNSKGMDLTLADLIKNQVLMFSSESNVDISKLTQDWNGMISNFESDSRITTVEFVRIYWACFQKPVTKKELYKSVKRYLTKDNVVNFVTELKEKSDKLSSFTSSDVAWPSCSSNSQVFFQNMGEINTLKYSICFPVLLYSAFKVPNFLEELSRVSLSFLFRHITICDYSVGTANETFLEVLNLMKGGEQDNEKLLRPFKQNEAISDDEFKKAFQNFRTKNNTLARYILGKIEEHKNRGELQPNPLIFQVEHILPQNPEKWIAQELSEFESENVDDYIYSIGNMTLLHEKLNKNASNSTFAIKVNKYRSSSFFYTKEIVSNYDSGNTEWTSQNIDEKCKELADLAVEIWPLEQIR